METQDLRKAGLKVTHPRMRILEILEASDGKHMTAEDIYRKLLDHQDDIGLATVYRVLTQFEAAGLVAKHNFESGQAVYEIERGKHHDHMVDLETGRIIEFVSEDIEKLQREIADRHGYVIEEHSLVLYVRPKKKGLTVPFRVQHASVPASSSGEAGATCHESDAVHSAGGA